MPDQTYRDQLAELIDDDITRQVQAHGLYISEGPYQGEIADAILKAGWRPPAQRITENPMPEREPAEQLRIIDRALWVDHGGGSLSALTGELPIWADDWAERIVAAVNRPPARVIRYRAELDRLPDDTVIHWEAEDGLSRGILEKGDDRWWAPGAAHSIITDYLTLPVTVLYSPAKGGGTDD
ncbi:hypothetical protein [Nocardia sp. CA-290969]|uniref:hypothetical protein n=1 Tax=Nocardia sp. CA-290969 TaxID=3239986 RepID=UPI003D93C5F7